MNITPASVASARTARLAREVQAPAYTTSTSVVREHLVMVEVDDTRGRYWSGPYRTSQVKGVTKDYEAMGYTISDIDHAAKCWCFQ